MYYETIGIKKYVAKNCAMLIRCSKKCKNMYARTHEFSAFLTMDGEVFTYYSLKK